LDTLKFTVINYDPTAPEGERFLTDSDLFKAGNQVEFQYGFEDDFRLSPWRNFKIVEVEERYPEGDIETVTVICHDNSKNMHTETKDIFRPKAKKSEKNEDIKYSLEDVAKEIAAENNLTYIALDEAPAKIKQNGWQQKKQTDIQFLSDLAQTYGLEVYVEGDDLFFGKKTKKFKEQSWGILFRGQEEDYSARLQENKRTILMYDFEPDVDIEEAAAETKTNDLGTRDNKEQKQEEKTTRRVLIDRGSVQAKKIIEAPERNIQKRKSNVPGRDKEDAKNRNEASQQQNNEGTIKARADCLLHPQMTAKVLLTIEGRVANKWKQRKYYVESMLVKMSGSDAATMTLDLTMPPDIGSEEDTGKADTSKNTKNAKTGQRRVEIDRGNVRGTKIFIENQ